MRVLIVTAIALPLAAACLCTVRLGWADCLFHKGTPQSVERARRLAPGNASYLIQPGAGRALAERAVRANPRSADGWIELGLAAELEGRRKEAEEHLLEAARVDRTYVPRWTLANFYFRMGDAGQFWRWARLACEMAHEDQTPLFRLCRRVSQDPAVTVSRVLRGLPAIQAQFLRFLLIEGEVAPASAVAGPLAVSCSRREAPVVLEYCERALMAGEAQAAQKAWNALSRRGLVAGGEIQPAEGRSLVNGEFASEPLGLAFDWRLHRLEGVSAARSDTGLRFVLSGRQPESCVLLEQVLLLAPSSEYLLQYEHRASGGRPGSGLRWELAQLDRNTAWHAAGSDLSSEQWTKDELAFSTAGLSGPARLALVYRRPAGAARLEGRVWLRRVALTLRRSPPEPSLQSRQAPARE